MTRTPDRTFARNVLASVIGAALFVPVESVPWWVGLLRDLPFGSWLWPPAGGAVTWLVYRMGVRAGLYGVVAADPPADLGGSHGGDPHWGAESEENAPIVPVLDRERGGPSGDPEKPLFDSLVQTALSLKDSTPVEVERQKGASAGQGVTVSGSLGSVREWDGRVHVHLTLDCGDAAGQSAICHLFLDFEPSLTPALKALVKGTYVRARGTVRLVEPESISLEECELLRIGGAATVDG